MLLSILGKPGLLNKKPTTSVVELKYVAYRIAYPDLWVGGFALAMRGVLSSGADAR